MFKGEIALKGDKSITHRVIMMSSINKKITRIINPSNCVDVFSTISVLNQCGALFDYNSGDIIINKLLNHNPYHVLNCGNSGTTARLLIGLLFGQGYSAIIDGDDSLRSRPMDRVLDPLALMNLKYESKNKKLPIKIHSSIVAPVNHTLVVPSAQVKSSIILATFGYKNNCRIVDKFKTRDHTERMIKHFQSNISLSDYVVPGDISNAAFLIGAAVCINDSNFSVKDVLFNKTRNGLINTLIKMNANISISNIRKLQNEEICDINVKYSPNLISYNIDNDELVSMIDEIPIYAIISCFVKGKTTLINAPELRLKESDRISELCVHLSSANINIIESDNGFEIKPEINMYNTIKIESNDHRIIMACEIFNLIISGKCSSMFLEEVSISFPDFYSCIEKLTQ